MKEVTALDETYSACAPGLAPPGVTRKVSASQHERQTDAQIRNFQKTWPVKIKNLSDRTLMLFQELSHQGGVDVLQGRIAPGDIHPTNTYAGNVFCLVISEGGVGNPPGGVATGGVGTTPEDPSRDCRWRVASIRVAHGTHVYAYDPRWKLALLVRLLPLVWFPKSHSRFCLSRFCLTCHI